jgi:hypothetical protein
MLTLILLLILWSGVLVGFGAAFRQLFFGHTSHKTLSGGLGSWMFLGLMGLSAIGLVLNFFIPLSQYVSLFVCGLGLFFLARNISRLRAYFELKEVWLWLFSIFVTSLMAITSFYNIDTGYYHLPAVTLIRAFPILPGMANVFGPYGHMSTWFLIEALLGIPGVERTSIFSLNALLVVCFFMFLGDWIRQRGSTWSNAFCLMVLFSFNHLASGLGGLTPDLPASILSCVLWMFFLESALGKITLSSTDLSFGLLMTLFAITIKVSTLVLLFPLSLICIFYFRRDVEQVSFWEKMNQNPLRKTILVGICFTCLWLARSIIASGCLVFPQALTCFERLPWALPIEKVSYWMSDVKYHLCGVRIEGTVFSNTECLKNWFYRFRTEPLLKILSLALGLNLLCGLSLWIKRPFLSWNGIKNKRLLLSVLVLGLSSGVWLVTAPNLRFALWIPIAAVGLFYGALFEVANWKNSFSRNWVYVGIVWACLITLRSALLTRPVAVDWVQWPILPRRGFGVETQMGSVAITSPIGDFKCWDSSPPCTPEKPKVQIHQNKLGRVWFSSSEKQGKVDNENSHRG